MYQRYLLIFYKLLVNDSVRYKFDVCVTMHHWYNNINSQLDATIIILLIKHWSCCLLAASPVHYTASCKHSLMLLRMGEIIARNMMSWLKLLIKLLLLHLLRLFILVYD